MATGTVVITENKSFNNPERPVKFVRFDWTSASNVASDVTTSKISGDICKVQFIPGTSSNQPTDLYDVTVTDENGFDVLSGQGANLSNSANSEVIPGVPLKDGTTTSVGLRSIDDKLTLNVTNAGNAKTGSVVIFYR